MQKISIFTLHSCPHCHDLKKKLERLEIEFYDIDVSVNKEIWKEVVSQTGYDALPTVFIPTDQRGNGSVYNPERDFKDIDELVDIIKNNI